MDVEDRSGINGAWEGYRAGQDNYSSTNELRLNVLLASMTSYASGVVWKEMRDRRPDIVNDCLLRALRGLPRFREESKFSTWFHRIVVNRCKTVQRVEGRRREVELGEDFEYIDWHDNPKHPSLEEAVRDLRGDDYSLFHHRVIDGYSMEELGEIFKITPTAARGRWRRIKEKLRRGI